MSAGRLGGARTRGPEAAVALRQGAGLPARLPSGPCTAAVLGTAGCRRLRRRLPVRALARPALARPLRAGSPAPGPAPAAVLGPGRS